jgi:hypothetical protein
VLSQNSDCVLVDPSSDPRLCNLSQRLLWPCKGGVRGGQRGSTEANWASAICQGCSSTSWNITAAFLVKLIGCCALCTLPLPNSHACVRMPYGLTSRRCAGWTISPAGTLWSSKLSVHSFCDRGPWQFTSIARPEMAAVPEAARYTTWPTCLRIREPLISHTFFPDRIISSHSGLMIRTGTVVGLKRVKVRVRVRIGWT